MAIVDNAVYVDGHRTADPEDLDETYFLLRQRQGMAWIGLYQPDVTELQSVASEFGVSGLAVEKVEFGEIRVFAGPDFVVTVRHAESPDLARVRRRMESQPDFLALGPPAVLYAILDQVVDEYEPVAAGLENDIDEIEDADGPQLQHHFRDVLDRVLRLGDRIAAFRALLQNAWMLNAALVAQRQNDEMRRLTESSFAQNEQVKRISAWAAILFAPTQGGIIYGMNFRTMPELDWGFGYPLALGLMAAMGLALYWTFKRNRWI